jgi:hypothetical protein
LLRNGAVFQAHDAADCRDDDIGLIRLHHVVTVFGDQMANLAEA